MKHKIYIVAAAAFAIGALGVTVIKKNGSVSGKVVGGKA